MTSNRITLVAVPLLLALAASAQTPPAQPTPATAPVHQVQVQQATIDEAPAQEPTEPLTFAEVMPTFPGGEAAFMDYMVQNVTYPASAREAGIRGRVFVEFVVEKDGSITNVKLLRGVPGAPEMDNEALHVVKTMPRWTPGKQGGEIVAVVMHLPIAFELQQQETPAQR
jgi:protein TonB